jgi:hypothetical protein
MGRTIQELGETMSYPEFKCWMRYWEHEPFGSRMDDYRFGMLAALIANCHTAKGKKFRPIDFMYSPQRSGKQMSVADIRSVLNRVAQEHNAALKGRKNAN